MANVWNENVIRRFRSVETNSNLEKRYYGPYNKLLTSIFPPDSDFTVAPVTHPIEGNLSTDLSVEYMVTIDQNDMNMPVLFVEIKDPTTIGKLYNRRQAHKQMLERFQQMGYDCLLDTFYGISAFGTLISIYSLNRENGEITPQYEEENPRRLNNNIPEDSWNIDILENDGAIRLNNVFNHIIEMCNHFEN